MIITRQYICQISRKVWWPLKFFTKYNNIIGSTTTFQRKKKHKTRLHFPESMLVLTSHALIYGPVFPS